MEIMIVVAIIGLLIAVAVPNFSKMRRDAQKTACHAQLQSIDGFKEMWATQEKRADNDTPSESQLGAFFKGEVMPTCPGGGSYTIGAVTAAATYSAVLHVTNKDIPVNSGCFRPIRVITKAGTVVNVRHPGPVSYTHLRAHETAS